MLFNPDPTKQAQEVTFSTKSHSPKYPDLYFYNLVLKKLKTEKHLGLNLDERLNFGKHLKDKFAIANKGIGMLKNFMIFFPRHSLVTLYKACVQPHLDYADIVYNKPNNMNVCNKIESFQYNVALARVIKGKLYQERGFEYLSSRRLLGNFCLFYKIVVKKSPNYLLHCVSTVNL